MNNMAFVTGQCALVTMDLDSPQMKIAQVKMCLSSYEILGKPSNNIQLNAYNFE